MRTIERVIATVVAGLVVLAVGSAATDDSPEQILERLRVEERAREEARAAADAEESAARERYQRAVEAERERAAIAAREAAAAFEVKRAAMREWHSWFAVTLAPLSEARVRLYRRLPHRMFAAVRPACVSFAEAAEAAGRDYRRAPDRLVEVLARDLFTVYRESARHCVEGGYFSFAVREGQVRRIVANLIVALAPYGLEFPSMMRSHQID